MRLLLILSLVFFISSEVMGETKIISERDVIKIVITHGLKTQIAREEAQSFESQELAALGTFDANLTAEGTHTIDKRRKLSSAIYGTRTDQTDYSIGLTKKWASGTTTGAKFLSERLKISGSPFFAADPSYQNTWEMSLTQPLLKNFAGTLDRGALEEARKMVASANASSNRKIAQLVHDAVIKYWIFALAHDYLKISKEAEAAARGLLDITQKKKQIGMVEEIDVVSEAAHLKRREAGVTAAEIALSNAEADLKTAINPEDEIKPGNSEDNIGNIENLDTSLKLAYASRSDYRALESELAAKKIALKMARNKKLPEIDLIGSLQLNDVSTTDYGDAFGTDNPSITAGVNLSIPLGGRLARSEEVKSRHEREALILAKKELELKIKNEVDAALKHLSFSDKKLNQLQETERLMKERWQLEEKRYKLGRGSIDTIVRYQEEWIESRNTTLDAKFEYKKAYADYRLSTENF